MLFRWVSDLCCFCFFFFSIHSHHTGRCACVGLPSVWVPDKRVFKVTGNSFCAAVFSLSLSLTHSALMCCYLFSVGPSATQRQRNEELEIFCWMCNCYGAYTTKKIVRCSTHSSEAFKLARGNVDGAGRADGAEFPAITSCRCSSDNDKTFI